MIDILMWTAFYSTPCLKTDSADGADSVDVASSGVFPPIFHSFYRSCVRAKDYFQLSILDELTPNIEQGSCRTNTSDNFF